ncbi:MAG: ArsA family ATPase [Polyangiales bacterium]
MSRVQFFTGKGGVGKSSLVAATAIAAARQGRRPLIVELAHRATMQELFGEDIGSDPAMVYEGVHALRIDVDEAAERFVGKRTGAGRLARLPLLKRLFHAAPAVGEVLTLDRIIGLESETQEDGTPRWGPILVDLDASGHAVMFFSLSEVFEGLARGGPLRTLLDGFDALLDDPARSVLHLVTIPGPLPVQETLQLHAALSARRAPKMGRLFVNRVTEPRYDETSLPMLESLAGEMPLAVALAKRELTRAQQSAASMSRLDLGLKTTRLAEHALPAPLDIALALASELQADELKATENEAKENEAKHEA